MNYNDILTFTKELIAIPSPSGYTKNVINYLVEVCKKHEFQYEVMNNGNLLVEMKGSNNYTVGLSAHVDTLGAMVCAINSDGTLKFDVVGGALLPTYDGEYCQVITRDKKIYTGTFLSNSPAVHVFTNSSSLTRDKEHMHIRLDEVVHSKADVVKLGICNGDYIAVDPKTVITESGFIKSRFLDDKLSVAILFKLFIHFKENNITPKYNLKLIVSTNEEIGYGASYIPKVDELLACDMGCVGLHLEGSEEKVTICAKDSSGPYNYDMTTKLINLAKSNNLDYAIDIFPMYGSDVSAALKAGNNIRGALIGSGVAASHGMERSHIKGVINTFELLKLYVIS